MLLTLSLVAAAITILPTVSAQAEDRGAVALTRLRADAGGGLTVSRGQDGRIRFVGVAAHHAVRDPSVDAGTSPAGAARSHLNRYGAAFGGDPASAYDASPPVHGAGGSEVVRFSQRVDDVPVLGGELVITENAAGALESIAGGVAGPVSLSPATVDPARAEATARRLVRRNHPDATLTVTDLGRWIVDPGLAGLELSGGTRTVRRLEVRGRAGVRELVLIDDHTGRPAFRTSLIESANRVVCDDADVRSAESPCDSGFARSEGGGVSANADVNRAYDFAGEVSDFYAAVSGGAIDVTHALDVHVDSVPKVAATVRFCTNTMSDGITFDDPCPFPNAFWDGRQMYYGDGYAAADDVVGHEMTHGIIDQYSQLFYWGQSGAINESLADTMGEFIDHRNGADDDNSWDLGEDLPGGALRNMADPTLHQQPDTTASTLYDADANYEDAGGVHTNSGVGNKTAYLISQGGSFNGQNITGIDAGDPTLAKSARLYLQVIETLPSGADFAQLGDTLGQACATLQSAHILTAANCQAVAQARAATMLSATPTNTAQPADADLRCPVGTVRRVLLNSEAGTSAQQLARFSTDVSTGMKAFSRTPDWGSNATSGQSSWFVDDQRIAGTSTLSPANAISLPSGQASYLSFHGWFLLDHDPSGYYDGGTVDINVDSQTTYPAQHFDSWVNGPDRSVASNSGNPISSSRTFAGDSHGWIGSRLDLSQFAGHHVTPRFVLGTDADPAGYDFSMIGWYLDDIQIYTCDLVPGPVVGLTNTGVMASSVWSPVSHRISWKPPTVNPGAVVAYRIWVDGVHVKTVDPTIRSVQLRLSTTRTHTIRIRAAGHGSIESESTATLTVPSHVSLTLSRASSTLTFHGSLKRNRMPFRYQKLWVQTKSGSIWVTIKSAITNSTGAYTVTLKGAVVAPYRVRFAGAPGVTGSLSTAIRK